MGISNSVPIDSWLDRHACSGRNITWQYIHNNGLLTSPYIDCPWVGPILTAHCCDKGVCKPSYFNGEFIRYRMNNWDGLGDPYNAITNTNIDWSKTESHRKGSCLGMEGGWNQGPYHWPPLGLDGQPTKNFSSVDKKFTHPLQKRQGGDDGEQVPMLAWQELEGSMAQLGDLAMVGVQQQEDEPKPKKAEKMFVA